MSSAIVSLAKHGWDSVKEELRATVDNIRRTRLDAAFFLAVLCVGLVIVGNVMLLITLNFWIVQFPTDGRVHNSSQIAIQVVSMAFLVLFFAVLSALFTAVYSALPMWHVLVDKDRVGGRCYRFFLLFASGATNGISSVLAVYAMTYTPEFIQAVLLCCVPFSAQAWTVLLIPFERQRHYISMFFMGSFLFFIAGVLLSSLSAFLHPSESGEKASWAWAMLYLVSTVFFGLWCVVQRLYLDAVAPRASTEDMDEGCEDGAERRHGWAANTMSMPDNSGKRNLTTPVESLVNVVAEPATGWSNTEPAALKPLAADEELRPVTRRAQPSSAPDGASQDARATCSDEEEDALPLSTSEAMVMKRRWDTQNVNDNAAKLVLLLVGLLFQLLVSFVLFPIDAIPWFGTSTSVSDAWDGFHRSMNFLATWEHVRPGLLYSLGFAMSFIGCTFLNEHSPTLASVVLQLAGPITSLVIIIVPSWNVYKDSCSISQKVGGVILLFVAALLYHLWEQQSLRRLQVKMEEAKRNNRHTVEEAEATSERIPFVKTTDHALREDAG